MLTIQQVMERFQLAPLTGEGGLFRQTYQSADNIDAGAAFPRFQKGELKPASTAIQYMITPQCYSRLHRLPTDEVYHFYLGSPVQMLLIPEEGEPKTVILGQDVLNGMEVQFTVPAGCWQGTCLVDGGEWALVGTTMAPGYTDTDYQDADPGALKQKYPAYAQEINVLTAEAVFPV